MFEKIFQKLKDSRSENSTVSDRTLETLAHNLATVITTDEILATYNAKTAIDSVDGNIRNEASNAIKRAEDIKKKADEDAKKLEDVKKADELAKKVKTSKKDEVPEYVQAILAQNKLLAESLQKVQSDIQGINAKTVRQTREEVLNAALKDVPDYVSNTIKNSFKVAKFETDEVFTEYINSVKTDTTAFKDAAKAQGLNTFSPSKEVKKPEPTGETPSLSEARILINKQKEKQNATNSK